MLLALAMGLSGATARPAMIDAGAKAKEKTMNSVVRSPTLDALEDSRSNGTPAIPEPSTVGLFAITVLLITSRYNLRRR